MSANRWDAPDYQRMVSIIPDDDHFSIKFQNGDIVRVEKLSLLPKDTISPIWGSVHCETYDIIVPTTTEEIRIPWTTIRLLSDAEFAAYWVKVAEKQARDIGKRLKELREYRNLTSKEVAIRAGITPQSLSRIENGHHDVVFTTLRRILAAMGCTLRDLADLRTNPTSLRDLLTRLESVGIKREWVLDRLLPDSIYDKLSENESKTQDNSLLGIAGSISKIFKWSPEQILGSQPLVFDPSIIQSARFKTQSRIHEQSTIAYAFIAHYISLLVLQATEHLPHQQSPNDPIEIRELILERYGSINLENMLRYIWSLGIPVLPLNDSGAFHGACWHVNGRNIIVLKQVTQYQGRWLFDLCHELGHVSKHLSEAQDIIIETQEISPFHEFDDEWEASQFASNILFAGDADELAEMSVKFAKNKVEFLKSAVLQVSNIKNVQVDLLANYLAFRLSKENKINWWGTANNLQITEPHPWVVTKELLLEQVDPDALSPDDYELLKRALSE